MSNPIQHQLEIPNEHVAPKNDECFVVNMIKKYIEENDLAKGKENKKRICEKMYNFLIDNKWFIKKYHKFANAVYKKLLELEDDWDKSQYYKRTLFPNGAPVR